MIKCQRFRLTRSAIAIAQRDSRNSAMIVPEGAILDVLGGPNNGVPLMDVRYNGEEIMMFSNDLQKYTKAVEARTA